MMAYAQTSTLTRCHRASHCRRLAQATRRCARVDWQHGVGLIQLCTGVLCLIFVLIQFSFYSVILKLVKMNRSPNNKPKVCRRLFAADLEDTDEAPSGDQPNLASAQFDNAHNNVLDEMLQTREQAREKWNFDFETETPLTGDWEWERVEPQVQPIGRVQVQPQLLEKTRDVGNNKSL